MRARPRVRASPAAPGPAGEVGDLPLDDGPVRPVALLPGRVALGGAGLLQDRLVRVDGDACGRAGTAVHAGRSGQPGHQGRNEAVPPPRAGAMTAVCPAGQVTVPRARSTVNRSLGNRPAAFGRAGTWR